MNLLALIIALVALIISGIAYKINRDNNIINYLRISIDVMMKLKELNKDEKPLIKNLIKRNRIFIERKGLFGEKVEELQNHIINM